MNGELAGAGALCITDCVGENGTWGKKAGRRNQQKITTSFYGSPNTFGGGAGVILVPVACLCLLALRLWTITGVGLLNGTLPGPTGPEIIRARLFRAFKVAANTRRNQTHVDLGIWGWRDY